MLLNDSSLNYLYNSAVKAFPNTKYRQNSVDQIKIAEINWTPYLGLKTLFTKAIAQSGKSHKDYSPIILFRNVIYNTDNENNVKITANDGREYFFEKLNYQNNDVLVRCNCEDFKWRFCHTNYLDHSLFAKNRKKYEAIYRPGIANPTESPGLCKHLMKFAEVINKSLQG